MRQKSVTGICGEVREKAGLPGNEEKHRDEMVVGGKARRKLSLSCSFVGTLSWACLQHRGFPCLPLSCTATVFHAPSQQTNHRTHLISNAFWSSNGVVVLRTVFPLLFNFISVLGAKELRLISMSLYFTLLSLIYNIQLYSSWKSCPLCIFAAQNKDPFSLFLV